jgi:hypothetical protein
VAVLLSTASDSPLAVAIVQAGWRIVRPEIATLAPPWTDAGLKAAAAAVPAGARAFLIAEHELSPAAFYAASRTPDIWTAAVAVGGSPRAAIATNRLFGANTQITPVLWIAEAAEAELFAPRLRQANFRVEVRNSATAGDVVLWLRSQQRDAFPDVADCETGNPQFGRCFWVEMTSFDAKRRNDVLNSTRVHPGSGAYLDLGGFGYDAKAPGPGVLVSWLPEKYSGPLQTGDRIVAVAGKDIRNAQGYIELMDAQVDSRAAAVIVLRGKERKRIETRIVLPPREETVTARVQARYLPETREILLITRQVSGLRVTVPEAWSGAGASWNGQDLGKLDAGCWSVDDNGAQRCR